MCRIGIVFVATVILSACGSDDNHSPVSATIPEITAFKGWNDDTPRAIETIDELSDLSVESEISGNVPDFFSRGSLMSRDERDNVQNGYVYPLYFATRDHDYPSRQWADGYTVQKGDPSDSSEARKVEAIRADITDLYGNRTTRQLFYGLSRYGLIDVRHYSFKPAPPAIQETCFTVRYKNTHRGTVNFCYSGHRFVLSSEGAYPTVQYNNQTGAVDSVEAFKLFAVSVAAFEVMFQNEDNRQLRDFFITQERLSVQMHKANDSFGGIFDFAVEDQNYLDGRQ